MEVVEAVIGLMTLLGEMVVPFRKCRLNVIFILCKNQVDQP